MCFLLARPYCMIRKQNESKRKQKVKRDSPAVPRQRCLHPPLASATPWPPSGWGPASSSWTIQRTAYPGQHHQHHRHFAGSLQMKMKPSSCTANGDTSPCVLRYTTTQQQRLFSINSSCTPGQRLLCGPVQLLQLPPLPFLPFPCLASPSLLFPSPCLSFPSLRLPLSSKIVWCASCLSSSVCVCVRPRGCSSCTCDVRWGWGWWVGLLSVAMLLIPVYTINSDATIDKIVMLLLIVMLQKASGLPSFARPQQNKASTDSTTLQRSTDVPAQQ